MPGFAPDLQAGKEVRCHTVVHSVQIADHTQPAGRNHLVRLGVVRPEKGSLAVADIDLVVDPIL